jgi:hypothetical protein
MNWRNVTVAAIVFAAVALAIGWFFYAFEYVEWEIPAPLHGEARYNPFYALAKVLRAEGVKVESHANFNLKTLHLGAADTLVLGADARTLSDVDVDQLFDWMDQGGHLVFALPPGSEGRGGKLLDDLGLKVVDTWGCVSWRTPRKKEPGRYCSPFAFKFDVKEETADGFDVLVGDAETGYRIGRQSWGDGGWLVVSDLKLLHNAALNDDPELVWQVLAPELRGGTMHLVYAVDVPPLYVLLVRSGWPLLVPLLLALLAWLWARSQRFGPLLPLAPGHRRALLEHIRAAGEFTFRRGDAGMLYAPLRRAFDERLRRADPSVAALDGEQQATVIAQRRGLSPSQVRQALTPAGLGQPETFTTTIKTLQEMP